MLKDKTDVSLTTTSSSSDAKSAARIKGNNFQLKKTSLSEINLRKSPTINKTLNFHRAMVRIKDKEFYLIHTIDVMKFDEHGKIIPHNNQ